MGETPHVPTAEHTPPGDTGRATAVPASAPSPRLSPTAQNIEQVPLSRRDNLPRGRIGKMESPSNTRQLCVHVGGAKAFRQALDTHRAPLTVLSDRVVGALGSRHRVPRRRRREEYVYRDVGADGVPVPAAPDPHGQSDAFRLSYGPSGVSRVQDTHPFRRRRAPAGAGARPVLAGSRHHCRTPGWHRSC
jgi:hypothetical protein